MIGKNEKYAYCDLPNSPQPFRSLRCYALANVADERGFIQGKMLINRKVIDDMTKAVRAIYWKF